jgi:hypothetical protein
MNTVHLGSETEFVKITLNPPYPSEGWYLAQVEISVSGFRGQIEPWLEAYDIDRFATQLAAVYESLQGEAKLSPREEQFTLCVQARTGGHIHVQGVAWSKATYENKLEFSIEIDQSFLPETLAQLRHVGSNKS